MDDLPEEEILLDIFHRLPIKSIGICMCVNKNWRSLIKKPSFVSSHKNKKNQHLVFWKDIREIEVRLDNDQFDFHKLYTTPPQAGEPCGGWSITSCNGVICFENRQNPVIVLWNPTIQKSLTLPRPKYGSVRHRHLGFWFDSLTNDYKLIRFISWSNETPTRVEIFSLNENSWRILSQTSAPAFRTAQGTLPLLNGTLHWIIYFDHNHEFCSILGFDVNDAVFRQIEYPDVLRDKYFTLAIYKENSLAICCGNEHVGVTDARGVWVLKEYGNVDSWTKIWQYDKTCFPRMTKWRHRTDIIGLLNDGKVLCKVLVKSSKAIKNRGYMMTLSIDPTTGERKKLALFPNFGSSYYKHLQYFEESLILLDNANVKTL